MESYSSSSSSSVSCPFVVYQEEDGGKRAKPLPSYQSSLHAVRRVPKPITKKPIAPMPPTPPKIYKVEPLHFKETVQMLTTAPGFQSAGSCGGRRLQDVAPPPLDLKPKPELSPPESDVSNDAATSEWRAFLAGDAHVSDVLSDDQEFVFGETTQEIMQPQHPHPRTTPPNVCGGYTSPLGVPPLSPSSLAWWASILPSPGTLSSL